MPLVYRREESSEGEKYERERVKLNGTVVEHRPNPNERRNYSD